MREREGGRGGGGGVVSGHLDAVGEGGGEPLRLQGCVGGDVGGGVDVGDLGEGERWGRGRWG